MLLNYIFTIAMRKSTVIEIMIKKIPVVAAVMTAVIVACQFPYKPEQFVLPEWPVSPYKFPSVSAIDSFFNTHNVIIAFTLYENDTRVIYYVNFNDAVPAQVKLKKPAGMENIWADSPLISPDGSFVAFYLIAGNTEYGAYIQKLDPNAQPVLVASNGTEPHWWQDQDTTFLIYSDKYMVDDISALPRNSGHTFRRKVSLSGANPVFGPIDTIAPYPMNGGLSKDGRYLCTGYKRAAFYDIANDTLIPVNGNNQACNPSIDPDPANPSWMMFLNIEGVQSLTNPFLGNADFPSSHLGEHAFLLIADAGNTVRDYVPITVMGNSYHAWQCPEWSNNPQFAAAMALADDASSKGDGVIIKGMGTTVSPKEILVFTQGTGKLNTQRSTPYVWVGN